MCEADAAVDALHANCILLIFIEPREDVQYLRLGHLWNQLDHVIEDDGSLFAHLGCLIVRDLAVHIHKLLLAGRSHSGIHAREELHGSKLGSEALSIHQALNHAHNGRLKVTYADCLQYSLHAFSCLQHNG